MFTSFFCVLSPHQHEAEAHAASPDARKLLRLLSYYCYPIVVAIDPASAVALITTFHRLARKGPNTKRAGRSDSVCPASRSSTAPLQAPISSTPNLPCFPLTLSASICVPPSFQPTDVQPSLRTTPGYSLFPSPTALSLALLRRGNTIADKPFIRAIP